MFYINVSMADQFEITKWYMYSNVIMADQFEITKWSYMQLFIAAHLEMLCGIYSHLCSGIS